MLRLFSCKTTYLIVYLTEILPLSYLHHSCSCFYVNITSLQQHRETLCSCCCCLTQNVFSRRLCLRPQKTDPGYACDYVCNCVLQPLYSSRFLQRSKCRRRLTAQVVQSVEVVSLCGVLQCRALCEDMGRRSLFGSAHALVPLYQSCSVSVCWEKCGMPASSHRQSYLLCSQGEALLFRNEQWRSQKQCVMWEKVNVCVLYMCVQQRDQGGQVKRVVNILYTVAGVLCICLQVRLSVCMQCKAGRVKLCFSHFQVALDRKDLGLRVVVCGWSCSYTA